MTYPTMTADNLRPANAPTLYFIGVSTGRSSIQEVFPRWALALGLDGAKLQGIDMPLHAPQQHYRRVVEFIRADPLSLGALVTTHKIDLYAACHDLFDEIDPFAELMGEISCISKLDGRLICHAKDPISSGLALDAFVPAGHWGRTGADALCMGAGGSTIAISWYLSRPHSGLDRPGKIIVTNRSPQRLEHIRSIHQQLDTDTAFEYILTPAAVDNDRVLKDLPAASLVVNATGLGKDAPGSPLTDAASFPADALVWDLNYRGDLVFLNQAQAQKESRTLQIEDGWIYFLHGWTQVIAEVFHIEIPTTGPRFERLSELALETR